MFLAVSILFLLLAYDYRTGDYYSETIHSLNGHDKEKGISIAHLFYQWLGSISYLVPILISLLSFLSFTKKLSGRFQLRCFLWASFFLLWSSSIAALGALPLSPKYPSYGGILGIFIVTSLRSYLGSSLLVVVIGIAALALIFYAYTLRLEHLLLRESQKAGKLNEPED